MASMSSSIPAWLKKAQDRDHINTVLRVLTDREQTRYRARSMSQRQSDLSLKHRLAQLPSRIISNNHLTQQYSVAVGSKPENQMYNRYSDIIPYDQTMVDVDGRYLNANWVRERAGGCLTVATQAPLPHTAHEFLSTIVTRGIRVVAQLTQNYEGGRQKAHVYFPSVPGDSWTIQPYDGEGTFPPLLVTLQKVESIDSAHCMVSTVSVADLSGDSSKRPFVFRHMLYDAWPDHGVPAPEDRAGLLNFIRLADELNREIPQVTGTDIKAYPPMIVNCSAGVGRTGAFIALCSLLRANGILPKCNDSDHPSNSDTQPLPDSPLGPLPETVGWDPVAQEIDSLREQRPGMVQRPEQVLLIYDVLATAWAAKDGVETNA
ncbi:phosphatases II [Dentipellis sp. KUC8613]|nr:phosphatases II [Dentipellis sp. KUC8613]